MDQLVLVLVILFAAVLAEPLGERIGIASSVLMTLFGCALALIPAVPSIDLPPDLILPVVLPPLLYAAARRTSWRQFAESWLPITLRAVVLVLITTAAVAAIFHAWLPALPLAAAVVLGALVAPPDPVAATTMAARLGLPRRLVVILSGEGLFNDVTAIVIYTVAIDAVVSGHFSAWSAAADFAIAAIVGILTGVITGVAGSKLTALLPGTSVQVALGVLLPFIAYGVAERFAGSAVLAVVVAALILTEAVTHVSDRDYRLTADAFWDITEMLITGFVFGLIGLELQTVLRSVTHWPRLLGVSAAVIAAVVVLRLLWLTFTWYVARGGWRQTHADEPYSWGEVAVTWWAGMRGVVTVALALAVPLHTAGGHPFPGRADVLFAAFAVVLFTLLVQGPALPLVVRLTGVRANTKHERALEKQVWNKVLEAELRRLREIAASAELSDTMYESLREEIRRRTARADPFAASDEERAQLTRDRRIMKKLRYIREEATEAGRQAAAAARREPGMPPDLVDRVIRRLDLGPP